MRLGYTDEAAAFMRWIEDRRHDWIPDGSLQIMYGSTAVTTYRGNLLDHLSGYESSRPFASATPLTNSSNSIFTAS